MCAIGSLTGLGFLGLTRFTRGPEPETIYFGLNPIPDKVNVGPFGYDETADNMVLSGGAGFWTLSAEEYSLFISGLWQGKIVSLDSVKKMLPYPACE